MEPYGLAIQQTNNLMALSLVISKPDFSFNNFSKKQKEIFYYKIACFIRVFQYLIFFLRINIRKN